MKITKVSPNVYQILLGEVDRIGHAEPVQTMMVVALTVSNNIIEGKNVILKINANMA